MATGCRPPLAEDMRGQDSQGERLHGALAAVWSATNRPDPSLLLCRQWCHPSEIGPNHQARNGLVRHAKPINFRLRAMPKSARRTAGYQACDAAVFEIHLLLVAPDSRRAALSGLRAHLAIKARVVCARTRQRHRECHSIFADGVV